MKIEIEDIKKINVNKGDKLIIRFQERLSDQAIERVRRMLQKQFDCKVIIFDRPVHIDVVSEDPDLKSCPKCKNVNTVDVTSSEGNHLNWFCPECNSTWRVG